MQEVHRLCATRRSAHSEQRWAYKNRMHTEKINITNTDKHNGFSQLITLSTCRQPASDNPPEHMGLTSLSSLARLHKPLSAEKKYKDKKQQKRVFPCSVAGCFEGNLIYICIANELEFARLSVTSGDNIRTLGGSCLVWVGGERYREYQNNNCPPMQLNSLQ